MTDLDTYDIQIFLQLFKNPLEKYVRIAENVGLSPGVVKERIVKLKRREFLAKDGETKDEVFGNIRKTTETEHRYRPNTIGLTRQHVTFKGISTPEINNKIKQFCDSHPYTHFVTSLFGVGKSIYAQFDVPSNSRKVHRDTYNELAEHLNLTDVDIFEELNSIYGLTNLDRFDIFHNPKVLKHSRIVTKCYDESMEEDNTIQLKSFKPYSMSELDSKLLRELTINAKAKVTDLADWHDVNKSTVSRRLKNLEENSVLDKPILKFSYDIFGMNNYNVIRGSFKDSGQKQEFINFVGSDFLPMNLRLSLDDKLNYTLYSVGTSSVSTSLMEFLWSNTENFVSSQMNPAYFMTYYFYYKNYSEKSGWIVNNDYIKDDPLTAVL